MVARFIIILIISFPAVLWGQEGDPLWLDDNYRDTNYSASVWYTGFAMDKLQGSEKLIEALQRVEDASRNKLVEQIQINIKSTSVVNNQSTSITDGKKRSERIMIDYNQEIQTSTSASAVGVKVESHYDSNKKMLYAFAYVERNRLAEYYINQEKFIFNNIKENIVSIDNLATTGQKIKAHEQCCAIKQELQKAKEYRALITAIIGNSSAYPDQYNTLSMEIERRLTELSQGTKVFIQCIWMCPKYPQYEHIAQEVTDRIGAIISENDCSTVPTLKEADYIIDLTLSTAQRSDGSDKFGVISYYANVTGKITNTHTKKRVTGISLIQDARMYSAGKNESQAIAKAFNSQSFIKVMKETLLPGLTK